MSAFDIVILDINVRIVNSLDCGVFVLNVRKYGGIRNGE